jgi:hypothetical protein
MIPPSASRPTGRLIFFACLLLSIYTTTLSAHATDITKTNVHDVIHRADGSTASGTLLISWPSFRTVHNDFVAAGSTTVPIGNSGAFVVQLAPTDGATPSAQYRVVLQLTGASPEVQYWTVPATTDSGIVLAKTATASSQPAVDTSHFLNRAGDEMTGPLTLDVAPTGPTHAATKQYVDDALATAASKSYVDSAVASAASKSYVDSAVASARIMRNVKDYAAICDGTGSHDDSSSIQAAINSFGGKGGSLLIPDGCLLTTALTFPTYDGVHRGNLILQLQGSLLLKATLELPANISLIGSGTIGAVQFQTGVSARLEDWSGTLDPVLKLTGGNNHVENISVPWGSATGIRIDGSVNTNTGALARLNNVGAFVSGHALVINNYFWVWSRDSRFLNSGATDSIWITNTSATAVGYSGLIYLDDAIISGGGIRLDSQVTSANIGSLHLNRLMRENGTGPLLTLDTTNGDIEVVSLDHVADADPINVTDQVRIVSPAGTGRVYGLHIKGQPPKFGGDTTRAQIFLDGNDDTRFTDVNLGTQRFWNYSVRSRVWDIENIGNDSSFNALPFTSLPVNQDPTTWPAGGGSWTQGVLAPDGSTQAATLSTTSPIADAQVYRVTQPVALNDWVIAGVYVQGALPGAPAQPLFSFSAGTVPTLDIGSNYFFLTPRGFYESQWRLALTYAKVTNAGEGLADYILSLRADPTHSVTYAFPFLLRIPASANVTDAEIQRWARSILRNVVSGIPAGNYALRAHQRLYFGSDAYLSRTAAGQLGINGNALALASDLATKADAATTTAALATKADAAATTTALATKADANTLNAHISATATHGATGAIVGTTNTQTLQNKTLDSTNSIAAAAVSGNISGTSAGITGKTTPTGTLVGTTDTQTIQNKTLDATNSIAGAAVTGNISGNAATATTASACPTCTGGVFIQTLNTDYNVTSADKAKLIRMTPSANNVTLNLPATPPSSSWWIVVQSVNLQGFTTSINSNGANLDGSPTSTTPVTVPQGQNMMLWTSGTSYYSVRFTAPYTATTGNIGGSSLAAGACASGTVTIAGVVTGQTGTATASDGTTQDNYVIKVYGSAANTATVKVCAITSGTPTTKTYNVRIFQ